MLITTTKSESEADSETDGGNGNDNQRNDRTDQTSRFATARLLFVRRVLFRPSIRPSVGYIDRRSAIGPVVEGRSADRHRWAGGMLPVDDWTER